VVRRQLPQAAVGIVHEWDGFARLVEPGVATIMRHEVDADKTVATAAAFIRGRSPALMVVHLDLVDHTGHTRGWSTPDYVQAVEKADALVAPLLTAIDNTGMRASTIVMISADHGGVGKSHGGFTKAEIEVPWIISGPGVKRGHLIEASVSTTDTAPTILFVLGVPAPAVWVGRPVLDAFVNHQGERVPLIVPYSTNWYHRSQDHTGTQVRIAAVIRPIGSVRLTQGPASTRSLPEARQSL